MTKAGRAVTTFVVVSVILALGFGYFYGWLRHRTPNFQTAPATAKTANLVLQTVAAIGPKYGDRPDWVSYLIQDPKTHQWLHTTLWNVPAHALIHVTVYQYDGDSGLRNPLWGLPRGIVPGSYAINGQPTTVLNPADASHTFAVPNLGISVPLKGVADNAKNQCAYAPCTMQQAHQTITFSFHTGNPGIFRWQCMVPCAAGFIYGFGGPMQTIGYMDGWLNVQ